MINYLFVLTLHFSVDFLSQEHKELFLSFSCQKRTINPSCKQYEQRFHNSTFNLAEAFIPKCPT